MHHTDIDSCRFVLVEGGVGETPVIECRLLPSWNVSISWKQNHGMAVCRVTVIHEMIQAVVPLFRLDCTGSSMVEIPWGELLAALPSLEGERPG